jgi:hypothetical protein
MLWKHYVFRRGQQLHAMWDLLFQSRPMKLLYITGRGFDVRAKTVMNAFVENLRESRHRVESAKLVLVGFSGYQMSEELIELTEENARIITETFSVLGETSTVQIGSSALGEEDISASMALRQGAEEVLAHLDDQTDIVLDVSSLPRVVYLALLTGILHKLIPDKAARNALFANGVNFQVLVAEDAALDARIVSEDPSNDLVLIPGYSSALHAESVQDWPLVWFPVLGENKVGQLQKVMNLAIPANAEICPILPHPSKDLRRADRLLGEYREPLFDARETPTTNILLAHESQPFEAYRQLLSAMTRYRDSMSIMGGCRLVVTPLASKLITLGAGLACFEMRPTDIEADYGVAIPHAEPTRYIASTAEIRDSKPEITAMLLTGNAYDEAGPERPHVG